MDAIDFQPHTCDYCQKLVVDIRKRSPPPDWSQLLEDAEEGKPADAWAWGKKDSSLTGGALFGCTVSDIVNGASAGCDFYNWILRQECIHYKDLLAEFRGRIGNNYPYPELQKSIEDNLIYCLPDKFNGEQHKTVEASLKTESVIQADFRLWAHPYNGTDAQGDITDLEFFGFWDPDSKIIVSRTKAGFHVFTPSTDRSSVAITTRPITSHPGSDESLSLLNTWFEECCKHHHWCEPHDAPMPTRLVEVMDDNGEHILRLRDTSTMPSAEYTALSYCWGSDQSFGRCFSSNIGQLLMEIKETTLSPTIRDAITVTRFLKIKFLWVDALCIIQDSSEDKAVEIAQMPHIYGRSVITIAAARSDSASKGFLMERNKDFARQAFKLPYACDESDVGSISLVNVGLSPEPLDKRAWALQEGLLSRRTVEFGTYQTRWICQQSQDQLHYVDGWRCLVESFAERNDTMGLNDPIIAQIHPRYSQHDEKRFREIIRRWSNIV